MLRNPALQGSRHLPFVYVVGTKIFAFKYAAEAWRDEVCPDAKIETVSVLRAFGVGLRTSLPKEVKVAWDIEWKKETQELKIVN